MVQKLFRKRMSALLVFAMIISIFSSNYVGYAAAGSDDSFSDIEDSYAKAEIAALVEKNILSGFNDGSFKPTDSMTRAQLAKVIVLSSGLTVDTDSAAKFQDVESSNWFAGYVGALVKSGITQGTSATAFSPNKTVSREELAVFFIRAFGWEELAAATALDESISDLAGVSSWAKSSVSFAYKIGFIKGIANADGTFRFNPEGSADRQALARLAYEFVVNKSVYEEKVKLLTPAVEELPAKETGSSNPSNNNGGNNDDDDDTVTKVINTAGQYSFGNVTGDVTINVQNVTLKDTVITGDLYLQEGIGNGDVTLDNVTVTGQTLVYGGGANSIHVANSVLATIIVNKNDGSIRLVLEDGTNVQQLELQSGAVIQTTGDGEVAAVNISSSVPHNAQITFNGDFDSILVHAEQVAINFAEGSTIDSLEVSEEALGTLFHLAAGSTISRAIVNAIVSFAGTGNIQSSLVNVEGVDFDGLANKPVFEADLTVTSAVYTPHELSLSAIDATRQIVFTGVRDSGERKDITLSAEWSSTDSTVAEVVYGKVKAKGDGTTIIHANYGAFQIEVPVTVSVYEPGTGYPTISEVHVTNGAIDVEFDGDVNDVTIEHFVVTATVSGSVYELQNLVYSNGTITFDPVENYGSTLYVTVESDADKTKFAGSQSGQIKLTGFGGQIKNVAGQAVPNLTIQFRKGLDARTGEVIGSAVTDEDGKYFIYLAPGIYTGELGGEGTTYITTYLIGVSAINVKNINQNQTAIGIPSETETRIVLTWGRDPWDLDSHLIGPTVGDGQFHTWYADTVYLYEDVLIADLDLDDVSSYGPETTTIRQVMPGTYTFYVHNFSRTGTLATSEAKIEVYKGNVSEPTEVYAVPSETGDALYWIVFEMTVNEDGSVVFNEVNEFTSVSPVV